MKAQQEQHDTQTTRLRTDLQTSRAAQQETQTKLERQTRELESAHKKINELVARVRAANCVHHSLLATLTTSTSAHACCQYVAGICLEVMLLFSLTQTNQMQKLMEVYKSQISAVTSTAPKTAAMATAALAAESPKTANIRPMTAPTSTTQVSIVCLFISPMSTAQLDQLL